MRRALTLAALLLLTACGEKPRTAPPASASGGADGHDCAHAVLVQSVREEYDWIARNHPGFEMGTQSLSSCPDFPVDILEGKLPDGTRAAYYFNIKIVMEEERKMLEGH